MKKFLAAILAGTLLTACSTPKQSASVSSVETQKDTVTVVDHADRTVEVKTNPKSVVILGILPLPSMLSVYLGSASTITAMEPASMNAAKNGVLSEIYPEVLTANTDIMNGEDVNIESLITMNPDVVFCNANDAKQIEKIESAGLTAVGVSPTKWNYDCIETYKQWITLLDQIYPNNNSERSEKALKYAEETYAEIQDETKNVKDKQNVLFLFQYDENAMITSSSKFFGQWWCDAVGALNVAEAVPAENSNAKISMEQVYEWNPDVIIITNFTKTQPEDLYNNAIGSDDWSQVKAVKDKRVYKMPLGAYRSYTPGIETPLTLKWLAQAVYPETFSFDMSAEAKSYYKELFGIELTDAQIKSMYTPNSEAGEVK